MPLPFQPELFDPLIPHICGFSCSPATGNYSFSFTLPKNFQLDQTTIELYFIGTRFQMQNHATIIHSTFKDPVIGAYVFTKWQEMQKGRQPGTTGPSVVRRLLNACTAQGF